jgi:hypothetical protein
MLSEERPEFIINSSINSVPFMDPKCSLPCLQKPAIEPNSEEVKFRTHLHMCEIHSDIFLPTLLTPGKWSLLLGFSD